MDNTCIHGINKLKKPATKVIAPPGGKTQINIFGCEEPAPLTPVNPNQKKRNDSSIFAAPPPPTNNNNNTVCKADAVENQKPATNTGPVAPGGGRASTKVMAPPGGRSSINLFG